MDARLRAAMFTHLDALVRRHPAGVPSSILNDFTFEGRRMPLIVQPGIWKPRALDAALSIRTTYTGPRDAAPYEDEIGTDGYLRYKWRGVDPEHSDNRALRAAMRQGRPLAYFVGVAKGVYHVVAPVTLVAEEPGRRQFVVAVDYGQAAMAGTGATELPAARSYAERLTRLRLHQPVFRARVLRAYESRCALCRIAHLPLLDAAHILPDQHPRGEPVLPNGLALCKIHHAAFDANILGVRPDLAVEIRSDVLTEIDGPMLRHGLQELHGARLNAPRERAARPDPSRLEERYEAFRAAA